MTRWHLFFALIIGCYAVGLDESSCTASKDVLMNLTKEEKEELLNTLEDNSGNRSDYCQRNSDCCQRDSISSLLLLGIGDLQCNNFPTPAGCRPGLFENSTSKQTEPCPAGYFCPEGSVCFIPCTDGAYCPVAPIPWLNETTNTWLCNYTTGDEGPAMMLDNDTMLCTGTFSNQPCPAGFFCAHVTTREPCPSGSYCRAGSISAKPCNPVSHCPAKTVVPTQNYLGLIIFGGVLVALLLAAYGITEPLEFCEQLACTRLLKEGWHRFKLVRGYTKLVEEKEDYNSLHCDGEELLHGNIPIDLPVDFTLQIEFSNLGLTIPGQGPVLCNISGAIKPYFLSAVLGPSGAGKTTFLSTMAGKAYYGTTSGQLTINGEAKTVSDYRQLVGFVPQEDIMHRSLTVEEILTYQAWLRLPNDLTAAERKQKVDDVLQLLQISDLRDFVIGDEEKRGISGGQRKRVNIGMELVADPKILFLDEPTSGLDSSSSKAVLQALKMMARSRGLAILAVLHQPRVEIFDDFDEVFLLGKGGKQVYTGDPTKVVSYFEMLGYKKQHEHVNPADFALDIIDEYNDKLQPWDVKNEAQYGKKFDSTSNTRNLYSKRRTINGIYQIYVFLCRAFLLQKKTWRMILIDIFLVVLGGTFLGAIHTAISLQKLQAMNSLAALVAGLTTMLSSLRIFGSHRSIFWREAATGINRTSYFIAENIIHIPLLMVNSLLFLATLYTLATPRTEFRVYLLFVFLVNLATSGIGYLVSIVINARNAQLTAVVICLISTMLAGVDPTIPSLDKVVVGPALYSLSYARYMVEAIYIQEEKHYGPVFLPDKFVLQYKFGYDDSHYNLCIGILVLFAGLSRIVALLCLLFTHRGQQV